MRLFTRTNELASPEEMSVATRLQAVTNRGQAESADYAIRDISTGAPPRQRLFHAGEFLNRASSA